MHRQHFEKLAAFSATACSVGTVGGCQTATTSCSSHASLRNPMTRHTVTAWHTSIYSLLLRQLCISNLWWRSEISKKKKLTTNYNRNKWKMLRKIPADLCALIRAITANVTHTARYTNTLTNRFWPIIVPFYVAKSLKRVCGCILQCVATAAATIYFFIYQTNF